YYLHLRTLQKTGAPLTCELRLQRFDGGARGGAADGGARGGAADGGARGGAADGGGVAAAAAAHFWARLESRPRREADGAADGESLSSWVTFSDVTARKQAAQLLSAQAEILTILTTPVPLPRIVEGIVAALKQATSLDAVGLRLQEDGDYPFAAAVGYSAEFLQAENTLAVRYPDGGLCRDDDGAVSLECTCGLVLTGRGNPANPLFTPGGSAYTNDAYPLLGLPREEDPRLNPRNRCIHVGFQSIALVPIRAAEEIIGLLHLADRRKDRFTAESLRFYEGVGVSIGVALLRKQAEEEIRRLNAELEKHVVTRTAELAAVTTELEAFAYSTSHDLRAPLRAIDGFSLMVMEDAADVLAPEDLHHLERVRAAAQHLGDLIDDLLGLSRLARQDLDREPVDVSALAGEVAAELRAEHVPRVVEVVIAPGMTAHADPRLLRVLLRCLLDNAWKFTSKHETARVEIGVTDADGERAFFVRDDGAGFDVHYAEHLFGPFQRMHTRAEFEGDGIGLAMVQRLVNRHGGAAWAESIVEEGATFFFTLPREE
ncbi:MAG: ATP-binding protein, partial [Actinomycetes bacterium]